MSRVRIAFLGTPDLSKQFLEALIKDEHYEVVGVISQPDRPAGRKMILQASPVKSLAESLGIPTLSPETVNTEEIREVVKSWRAEACVVVAFGQILGQKFLDLFPNRVVNIHASLLPHLRGAAPVQRSLMAGETETGVTLQVMVKKLDAGPVLGMRKISVPEEMNAIELFSEMIQKGKELLEVDFMDYLRGNLSASPQNEEHATYAHKIEKSESKVQWSNSAKDIHNLVRGLAMGPQAYGVRQEKNLKIHRTKVSTENLSGAPGTLVQKANQLFVVCGQGVLELIEVQPESKPRMSVEDYLRGRPVESGEKLS
ncbi:MAG TPA: methionyl-tRNA formyltransferase [Bdellovibrionales bacterium]|nr:methionyl-tRNA formyltransferase [Pseudobdellovibrionaceae bacterium]HAG92411.1 methionyl-tRNA formyltransferase [Bdellovibrionales bacterium]